MAQSPVTIRIIRPMAAPDTTGFEMPDCTLEKILETISPLAFLIYQFVHEPPQDGTYLRSFTISVELGSHIPSISEVI